MRQVALFADVAPALDIPLVHETPNWEAWCGRTLRIDVEEQGLTASLPIRFRYDGSKDFWRAEDGTYFSPAHLRAERMPDGEVILRPWDADYDFKSHSYQPAQPDTTICVRIPACTVAAGRRASFPAAARRAFEAGDVLGALKAAQGIRVRLHLNAEERIETSSFCLEDAEVSEGRLTIYGPEFVALSIDVTELSAELYSPTYVSIRPDGHRVVSLMAM